MTTPVPLAEGFPTVSEADWRAAVSRSGADPQYRPGAYSDDGLAIGPIYHRTTGSTPIARPVIGSRWKVVQRVSARTTAAALAMCREEIAGGADGVLVAFAGSLRPLGGSLPTKAAGDLAAGLAPLLPEGATLIVDAGPQTAAVAPPIFEIAANRRLSLTWATDPIASIAMHRPGAAEAVASLAAVAALAEGAERADVAGTVALADGCIWHAAGASEVQEVAAVLASIIQYLRLFEDDGVSIGNAAPRLAIALAADTNQFLTIAKLRAMRLLAERALELAGIVHAVPIHAETAWRMMSRREPRMNVLRAASATFAAAVGGADAITTLPFDALDDAPTAAARRLARNTQLVIAEEGQISHFVDPAAGAGAVESLTDALAEKAWTRFQAIEAAGGMLAALSTGAFQQEIAATRDQRLARFADRKIEMIGVNAFVTKGEEMLPAIPGSPATTDSSLVSRRLAEDVESQS
jgi:methylmalonyl-CoA mutase